MDDPEHNKGHGQCGPPDESEMSDDTPLKSPTKRKYVQVNYEKRKELIQVIDKEHLTIKSAAEKLNINYPTAKNIVKLYRRDKRIDKLPKRPSLTIKKITSPPQRTEDLLYRAALSPFYNKAEAERIMGKCREAGPKKSPEKQVGCTSATSVQNCILLFSRRSLL